MVIGDYEIRPKADLCWADLRWADLRGADLHEAKLCGADLYGANLREANLLKADLRWADLRKARLIRAKGICQLPVSDPRGYVAIAVWHANGWMVAAGCHWFTIDEARRHWGCNYMQNRSIGDRYLCALDWLEKQPTP